MGQASALAGDTFLINDAEAPREAVLNDIPVSPKRNLLLEVVSGTAVAAAVEVLGYIIESLWAPPPDGNT